MCNFYSCIVDRNLKIYDAIDIDDSHETIITTYKLNDDKLNDRDFVRLELTPNVEKLTKKFNKNHWQFKVDEPSSIPEWFIKVEEKITKSVFEKLHDEIWQKYVLVDQEIDTLENDNVALVSNCKISQLNKSQIIRQMRGSSQVKEMRESSQVGEMWGSSQVKEMWGSSQVGVMRGSSQVKVMRESSQVGVMRESSQVGEMWGSSQVKEMRESSQVKEMWGSSQVKEMWGSSQVGEMRESSLITAWSPYAKISKQEGGNTVVIDRSGEKVKVKIK